MKIKNNKYKQQEQRYKYEVEKDGKYEYIRSYRRGDILPNSKIVGDSPYIQIKHKYCGNLSYDFYLPNYNLLIEYQGEQHEKYTLVFHTSKEDFNKQQEHDKRKKDYAKENEIELLEIWYWDFDNIEEILNKQINNIYLRGGDKDE